MSKTAKTPVADEASAATDSMQQVRELLFGEYQRAVDARLEQAFSRLEALRDETGQAALGLENRLLDQLQRLDKDTGSQIQSLAEELRAELQSVKTGLEQRIEDLQTLMQSEHQRMTQETQAQLDRLESAKTSRIQLADLMRQLADSLDAPKG